MTDQQTQIDWQARAEAAERQVREARGLLEVCINRLTQLCQTPCACTDKVECTTHAIANRVATYLTTPAPSPAQATEVERLRIALCDIHRYANGYLHHAETRAVAYEVMLKCTAALTPPADAQGEQEVR